MICVRPAFSEITAERIWCQRLCVLQGCDTTHLSQIVIVQCFAVKQKIVRKRVVAILKWVFKNSIKSTCLPDHRRAD